MLSMAPVFSARGISASWRTGPTTKRTWPGDLRSGPQSLSTPEVFLSVDFWYHRPANTVAKTTSAASAATASRRKRGLSVRYFERESGGAGAATGGVSLEAGGEGINSGI